MQLSVTRPSPLPLSALLPLAMLSACIPNAGPPPVAEGAPPPRMDADAELARVIEPEPVWTAQQVVPKAETVKPSTHVVSGGETLDRVEDRTGAGSEAIARANGLRAPYRLQKGQKLAVPGGRYHIVADGETGIGIAAAYGVAWRRVVEVNELTEPFILRRGQRLLLPPETPARTSAMEKRAAAFHIDIDDVLTGGQPAAIAATSVATAPTKPKPLPANVPAAVPTAFSGSFAWPLRGQILSRFGPGESGARNNGIDIAAPAGTQIRATADGVVAYAGDKVAVFGGLVLVNHGGGWVSAYGHAQRLDVTRGQKVKKGQIIGLTGDTGYASQPKLHFELRKDRAPVDPLKQLPPR